MSILTGEDFKPKAEDIERAVELVAMASAEPLSAEESRLERCDENDRDNALAVREEN